MRRHALLSITLVAGAAVAAAAPSAAGSEAPPIPVLDARISLDLHEARAADVFQTLQTVVFAQGSETVSGPPVTLRVEQPIQRTLTICVRDVTVRTVLAAICESLRCEASWEPDGDGYLLVIRPEQATAEDDTEESEAVTLDQPIDLELDAAKLGAVLRTLGAVSGRKFAVDEQLGERVVTVSVHSTPLHEVLDLLCAQAGCSWHETALGVLAFDPS